MMTKPFEFRNFTFEHGGTTVMRVELLAYDPQTGAYWTAHENLSSDQATDVEIVACQHRLWAAFVTRMRGQS